MHNMNLRAPRPFGRRYSAAVDIADEVSAILARLETSGGMSRNEIAECARLSKPTVWRLAAGDVRKPT
ncbi:hypothetical protein N8E89_24165 (plasmid) [Phyllobacterium sp. A18/5-2]|uniref:hypothetical protein n=1 Tax=Phyllobacterium sp. A18/5-2 TaxID=2978392 RepID=UPI0021C6B48E|nr:hypothetical protein [Phyllobacterium sp. A18/5-2]UXN66275.1 hypothetical protein N8E89_24165 [Phyllobacterium sp. A18/5-2]